MANFDILGATETPRVIFQPHPQPLVLRLRAPESVPPQLSANPTAAHIKPAVESTFTQDGGSSWGSFFGALLAPFFTSPSPRAPTTLASPLPERLTPIPVPKFDAFDALDEAVSREPARSGFDFQSESIAGFQALLPMSKL